MYSLHENLVLAPKLVLTCLGNFGGDTYGFLSESGVLPQFNASFSAIANQAIGSTRLTGFGIRSGSPFAPAVQDKVWFGM